MLEHFVKQLIEEFLSEFVEKLPEEPMEEFLEGTSGLTLEGASKTRFRKKKLVKILGTLWTNSKKNAQGTFQRIPKGASKRRNAWTNCLRNFCKNSWRNFYGAFELGVIFERIPEGILEKVLERLLIKFPPEVTERFSAEFLNEFRWKSNRKINHVWS